MWSNMKQKSYFFSQGKSLLMNYFMQLIPSTKGSHNQSPFINKGDSLCEGISDL